MSTSTSIPPSGPAARALTIASPLVPVVLPIALYFQRRARREAASDPQLSWSSGWLNRPILFTVIVWAAFLLLAFLLFGLGAALGMNMA